MGSMISKIYNLFVKELLPIEKAIVSMNNKNNNSIFRAKDYALTNAQLDKLFQFFKDETMRIPTTMRTGLLNPTKIIVNNRIEEHYTLNSCFAGFIAKSYTELIEHLKSYSCYYRIGGHGINADLLPIDMIGYSKIASMENSTGKEIIVSLCYSIWNVNILDLFAYLHPSSKIENINFIIMVNNEFKTLVNDRKMMKLYYPTYEQIFNQTNDPTKIAMEFEACEMVKLLYIAMMVSNISIINIDNMNERNMVPNLGKVYATNICTEIIPVGNFACNLASFNLQHFVKDGVFNWDLFEDNVEIAVRYLNLTINHTMFTTQQDIIDYNRKVLRPIGLGITGYATCLILLKLEFTKSQQFCYELCGRLLAKALETSIDIAEKYPSMAAKGWKGSRWQEGKLPIDLWPEKYKSYFKPIESLELRLNKLREVLKYKPLANLNLIAHMPTLRRAIEKNMTLSFTPLHSLVTEIGLESGRKIFYATDLEEKYYPQVNANNGSWFKGLPKYYMTSDKMDQAEIAKIYYIAQMFCDMSISITPHFRDNKIETIIEYLSNHYNLNTVLYYLRLDINAINPLNEDDNCKGGMCSI